MLPTGSFGSSCQTIHRRPDAQDSEQRRLCASGVPTRHTSALSAHLRQYSKAQSRRLKRASLISGNLIAHRLKRLKIRCRGSGVRVRVPLPAPVQDSKAKNPAARENSRIFWVSVPLSVPLSVRAHCGALYGRLKQHGVHRVSGHLAHARQDVTVRVQRDRHGTVSQPLADNLHVYAS